MAPCPLLSTIMATQGVTKLPQRLKSRLAARWPVELGTVSHYLLKFGGNAHAPTILRSRESRRSRPGVRGLDRRGCNGRAKCPCQPVRGSHSSPRPIYQLPDCRKPSRSYRRRPPIRLPQVFAPNSIIRLCAKALMQRIPPRSKPFMPNGAILRCGLPAWGSRPRRKLPSTRSARRMTGG